MLVFCQTYCGERHMSIWNWKRKPTIKSIRNTTESLLSELDEFTQSQKALWQRIPWLQVDSKYRTGYQWTTDTYLYGYYPVFKIMLVVWEYNVHIDLATGLLVQLSENGKWVRPSKVCLLAVLAHPERIDASEVVARIEHQARAPYPEKYTAIDITAAEKEKQELRERFNIQKIYRRK